MFLYILTGVIIFLIGFYAGRLWETRLKGKIISISVKTVCIIGFILLVLILGITSIKHSVSKDIFDSKSNPDESLIEPDIVPTEK